MTEREVTFIMEQAEAEEFTLDFPEQDMSVEEWREAYFNILVWKNTWCLAHEVDLCARKDHTAFIKIVVPKDRALETEDWLAGLGFKKIRSVDITIGLIDGWVDGIDTLYID